MVDAIAESFVLSEAGHTYAAPLDLAPAFNQRTMQGIAKKRTQFTRFSDGDYCVVEKEPHPNQEATILYDWTQG